MNAYNLYLYRDRGDYCLEDPHARTMLGERVRYRQPTDSDQWTAELWFVSRWLNTRQQGELRKIDPDGMLPDHKRNRLIRDFLERQP